MGYPDRDSEVSMLRLHGGARALLAGRHYFTHEDIHAVARGVLAHRFIVRPEAEVEGKRAEEVVAELIHSVPVLETAPR